LGSVCGHLELINVLKGAKADMVSTDVHSASPLHYAVQLCAETEADSPEKAKNAEAILHKLIAAYKPSHIDCVDEFQRTPLIWAASTGT